MERTRMRQKLGSEPKALLLWHGTRDNKPSMIYESQEGFDKRYANEQGMWGAAIYFARNASYSHAYSHASGGFRQMFLSEVCVGDFVPMPSGRYSAPPKKPGTDVEYDSIQGYTGGSDVYMVYSNNKSYPRYLITYK